MTGPLCHYVCPLISMGRADHLFYSDLRLLSPRASADGATMPLLELGTLITKKQDKANVLRVSVGGLSHTSYYIRLSEFERGVSHWFLVYVSFGWWEDADGFQIYKCKFLGIVFAHKLWIDFGDLSHLIMMIVSDGCQTCDVSMEIVLNLWMTCLPMPVTLTKYCLLFPYWWEYWASQNTDCSKKKVCGIAIAVTLRW